MTKIKRYHSDGIKFFPLLYQQKIDIEKNYDFIQCSIVDSYMLYCKGCIENHHTGYKYNFIIKFHPGREPFVQMLNKDIKPCREIHMYKDSFLCLAMSRDVNWRSYPSISNYTIPWIVEWTCFYELYKINNNIWEGKEAPNHFIFEQDNEQLSNTVFNDNTITI